MAAGTIHCTRTGCERTFTTEHGLSIHLARAHTREDEREEDSAIRRAEQQPVETGEEHDGDVDEETTEEAAPTSEMSMPITLEGDEQDLLDAVCFLYECAPGSCAAEAMTMWFAAMRELPDVVAMVELRKKVRDA